MFHVLIKSYFFVFLLSTNSTLRFTVETGVDQYVGTTCSIHTADGDT